MTTDTNHPLQAALEDAGYQVQSYSGRNMYGKKCLAVEIEMSELGSLVAGLIHAGADASPEVAEALAHEVEDMRTDSMGRGMVVYFPRADAPEARKAEIDYASASDKELEQLMQYGKAQHIRDAAEDELAGREAARDDLA